MRGKKLTATASHTHFNRLSDWFHKTQTFYTYPANPTHGSLLLKWWKKLNVLHRLVDDQWHVLKFYHLMLSVLETHGHKTGFHGFHMKSPPQKHPICILTHKSEASPTVPPTRAAMNCHGLKTHNFRLERVLLRSIPKSASKWSALKSDNVTCIYIYYI